jgi:hypothetical protein
VRVVVTVALLLLRFSPPREAKVTYVGGYVGMGMIVKMVLTYEPRGSLASPLASIGKYAR